MNKKIRIIKRTARERLQAEESEKAVALPRNNANERLQMAATITEWVSDRRQRASKLAEQSLKLLLHSPIIPQ
jgi:hypothetical protein